MSQQEQEIVRYCAEELLRNTGGASLLASNLSQVLLDICTRYGHETTVEGACRAMDDLAKWTSATKEMLQQRQRGEI